MEKTLLSTRTATWTVARQYVSTDAPVGTVITETYGWIDRGLGQPREYRIHPHTGCPNDGFTFTIFEAYSDNTHCTGCDFYEYHSIGD